MITGPTKFWESTNFYKCPGCEKLISKEELECKYCGNRTSQEIVNHMIKQSKDRFKINLLIGIVFFTLIIVGILFIYK